MLSGKVRVALRILIVILLLFGFAVGGVYVGYNYVISQDKRFNALKSDIDASMVGYQEILSDPSYTGQAVVMTYPLIGNYGMCADDYETKKPTVSAMIVREYNDEPSNFRAEETLEQVMLRYGIGGLAGVDTRALARYIRDKGTGKALLCDASTPNIVGVAMLRSAALRRDQVAQVSTKTPWISPAENARFHVVAVDCGIKHNIIRSLNRRGCDVTVVPWDITAAEVEAMNPDGVFLSNGPGNPEDAKPVIELVRELRGKYPIFGICLGHQIIALSYGAKTYKLKFGHRGGNHPVKNLLTGKVEITSQNHSYAVDAGSLDGTGLEVTHVNLLDNTVEGLRCEKDRVFSVQYHPESAPGPQDSAYLFDEFIRRMEETRNA